MMSFIQGIENMAQMNLPTGEKQNHRHGEQTCSCQRGKGGSGMDGELGLVDANYGLWNGLAMRSCCVALGTISSHL